MATRGRPAFKPTAAMREKVAIAVGGGMTHEEIAEALGIHRQTLERHFEAELRRGALMKRLEALVALQRAAKKGKVGAIRAYLAKVPTTTAAADLPAEKPLVDRSSGRARPYGKKMLAAAAAPGAEAGTDWDGLLPTHEAPTH